MLKMILGLFGGAATGGASLWLPAGLGAVVGLALGAGVLWVDRSLWQADVAGLHAQIAVNQAEAAKEVAEANVQAVARLKAEAARADAASAAANTAAAALARRSVTIHSEIAHAPITDDAPPAPVLRRTLDRLRIAPGAIDADAGAGRAGTAAR